MKNLLVSISGVRGIIGQGLTPEVALRYALAFGKYSKSSKVFLGRDSRPSGEMLKGAVLSGLLASGCDVVDLGICPTPTVGIIAQGSKAYGLVITASHNPIEWNGLKFIGKDGLFLSENETEKLNRMARSSGLTCKSWNRIGKLCVSELSVLKHISKILKLRYIQAHRIKKRKIRVVLDCNNGAGSRMATWLLKSLGCKVVELNCSLSGLFVHPPEPLPENIRMLCHKVEKSRADIGFALDPDGDRLAIVSEKGIPLGEEKSLALAARFILSKNKGNVAVNVSTSKVIEEITKEFGVKIYRTKVGEAFVARKLKSIKGIIGGEGNGGIILPALHYGRDALAGMALILEYLAETKKTISELSQEIPTFQMVKKKMVIKENLNSRLKKLENRLKRAKKNQVDGLRLDLADSWLHIRKSNTEPVVRIISEAKSKRMANKLANEAINILK